jgi:hypothetical protein
VLPDPLPADPDPLDPEPALPDPEPDPLDPEPLEPEPELPYPEPDPLDPEPLDPEPELPDPEPEPDPEPLEPEPELPDPEPELPDPLEPLPFDPLPLLPEPVVPDPFVEADPPVPCAVLELDETAPQPLTKAAAITMARKPEIQRKVFNVMPGRVNSSAPGRGLQTLLRRNAHTKFEAFPADSSPRSAFLGCVDSEDRREYPHRQSHE